MMALPENAIAPAIASARPGHMRGVAGTGTSRSSIAFAAGVGGSAARVSVRIAVDSRDDACLPR